MNGIEINLPLLTSDAFKFDQNREQIKTINVIKQRDYLKASSFNYRRQKDLGINYF